VLDLELSFLEPEQLFDFRMHSQGIW
jgi:hypothetical protein